MLNKEIVDIIILAFASYHLINAKKNFFCNLICEKTRIYNIFHIKWYFVSYLFLNVGIQGYDS